MRYEWAIMMKELLRKPQRIRLVICFLDEKWFYVSSRRNRHKHLPKHELETEEEAYSRGTKTRSRRFPIKSMFLAVISRAFTDWNTDGKIFLKRVSKYDFTNQKSYNQQFSDDYHVNHL